MHELPITVSRFRLQSLPALDPTVITGASEPVQAAILFPVMLLFGGGVIYLYGNRLDDAVDASMRNPLLSAIYGIVAYGGVVFAFGYAYSQLMRLGIGAGRLSIVAIPLFVVLFFLLAGLGFAVIGTWVTSVVGTRNPWIGLVGVVGVSAAAWLLLPAVLGAGVWAGIAAIGIGGPTRVWFHADSVKVEQS